MQLSYSETAHRSTPAMTGLAVNSPKHWLAQPYRALKQWLIMDDEITIKPVLDHQDNLCWEVYDPRTKQHQWMSSEQEALDWIETHRHRPHASAHPMTTHSLKGVRR